MSSLLSPTSPKSSTSSSKLSRHLGGALNTRMIGIKHRIILRKSPQGGFGIKIAERDNMYRSNRPIYITAITTVGSAYKDGRLKEGDMLLEINGLDITSKSQLEVTRMLKNVSPNDAVELVVSRQENIHNEDKGDAQESPNSMNNQSKDQDCDNDTSLIDLDVPDQDDLVFDDASNSQIEKRIDRILNEPTIDGPGTYIYDVPLNDTKSAGLGLYLKFPKRSVDNKDLGVWIEKVITGGAAWKDGRLQPDDQILAINGINLVGLPNSQASETLTTAVSRGEGLTAPNTIRLHIQRRDPVLVAKIHRIDHTDIPVNNQEKSYSTSERNDHSKESYRTAFDNTIQTRSTHSVNETYGSSGSSNQISHNDSAMSPQTQASNSLKLSYSCNEKFDQNNSDKTNDTSSAISQITDFTNVPINDVRNSETSTYSDYHQTATTLPKSLQLEDDTQNIDHASSTQSWDDESVDAATGEDRFQRDGFGRQSISEKRHAQLMAKNTDTFKRNQMLREEREQRQLEEQLARQRLDDDNRRSYHLPKNNHKLSSSYTTNEFRSIYGLHSQVGTMKNQNNIGQTANHHREVPVDVHLPVEARIEIEPLEQNQKMRSNNQREVQYGYNNDHARLLNHHRVSNMNHLYQQQQIFNHQNMLQVDRCLRCGSVGPCACETNQMNIQSQIYGLDARYDQMPKRSNSLESVQHHQTREDLVVPRSGTVRVARNRKVDDNFRVALDRSYDNSTNDSNSRQDQSEMSDYRRTLGPKVVSSIANSTASTSNDERYLINNTNGSRSNETSHKKSSLLTKFLKFGSMKKSKRKNRDNPPISKPIETTKTILKDNSSRESETKRSQSSKGSHSRTQSSQSHPNLGALHQNSHNKHEMMNGQLYSHNHLKEAAMNLNRIHSNGADLDINRTSLPICQYRPMPNINPNQQVSNNHQHQQHQHPMTQAKYLQAMTSRPANIMNNNQYSHVPMHQQNQSLMSQPPLPLHPHRMLHPLPVDMHNRPYQLSAPPRGPSIVHNQQIPMPNNCQTTHNQWQPPPPPIHAPNGLWVANSPVSENQILPNSIYGTASQHNLPSSIQQHRPPANGTNMSHSIQLMSPMTNGGPNTNGISMQQQSILPGQSTYSTHQHLHNQQPQHIYYYDF